MSMERFEDLTKAEQETLRSIVASARRPIWWHILTTAPGVMLFLALGGLNFFLPSLLENHGIALCQRHGTLWLPMVEFLPKLLRTASGITELAILLLVLMGWGQMLQNRRLYALLGRLVPKQLAEAGESVAKK